MASTDQAIGMMDAAYFTGRKEILQWINATLALGITKIESTCTGAIACQLIDAHFPNNIPMSKVNWEAKSDYEYFNNYKVLQSAFNKLNIEKKTDVEKLCRGKYQDNLEFMQWFKGFLDRHSVADGYDPIVARSKGKGAGRVENFFGKPGTQVTTVKPRRHASSNVRTSDKHRASAPMSAEKENRHSAQRMPRLSKSSTLSNEAPQNAQLDDSAYLALERKVATLDSANNELKLQVEGLEKERDFYFDKLREIEVLLQTTENTSPLMESIFEIMYHTTDEFVVMGEDS